MEFNFNLIPTQLIKVKDLEPNKGQIDGVPKNPRVIKDERYRKLVQSIQEDPEFLTLNCLHVYKVGKKYVVSNGNMRLKACKELGIDAIPCKVIPSDTPAEKLQRYIMKDNAMRSNAIECLEQIDYSLGQGFLYTGLTQGLCEAKFIRAKYYGERYPQYLSLYFTPERFKTASSGGTIYDAIVSIKNGKKGGISGLRIISEDGNIIANIIGHGSYPIGGAKLPLDFPSDKAKELIEEFSKGKRVDVLDPCHGWGGRLVGSLLADVKSYTGIDPSEEASRGVMRMYEVFKKYCPNTKCTIIQKPFEDVALNDSSFDIALTSPPYFDVEKYHGEKQSHTLYPKYDIWVEKFYQPLINNTYRALRDGGVFILQVGSQQYPLRQDGERIAESVGFIVEDVRPFGGQTASALHGNTHDDYENEKVIILRKGGNS